MEQIDSAQLQEAILNAPAWARIGITVRDRRMRERAAAELASTIKEQLSDSPARPDPNQLRLF
ncbi:DUF6771 family protein [uncultured Novosphingobium sp.]|uniref:DUF6771 family protein n=1 Tax=uncultured Novosphingobium sp. TaxID=292277 RepID=UPI00258A6729|nr:DUF6771 family protein [uncultured Novosphingobium sp.]